MIYNPHSTPHTTPRITPRITPRMGSRHRLQTASLAAAVAVLTTGCGGGGKDPEPEAPPTFTGLTTQMGDWYAYSSEITPTVGGGSPSVLYQTRTDAVVSGDGSRTQVRTFGTGNRSTRTFNASGGLTGLQSGSTTCTYTGDARTSPPLGTRAGEAYRVNYTETCTSTGSSTAAVWLYAGNGTFNGVETRSLPVGTFSTFKYTVEYTITLQSGGTAEVSRWIETCWVDRQSGRAVECNQQFTSTPVGQSAPSRAETRRFVLDAYSYRGAPAVGPAIRRFVGPWVLKWFDRNTCTLTANNAGGLTGSCELIESSQPFSAGGGSYPTLLSGSVQVDGSFSVSSSRGAVVSGQLTSPLSGSATLSGTMNLYMGDGGGLDYRGTVLAASHQ